jgi:plastocyanin
MASSTSWPRVTTESRPPAQRIQKVAIAGNTQAVVTFSAAGDYHITCLIHHAMKIVVHVH